MRMLNVLLLLVLPLSGVFAESQSEKVLDLTANITSSPLVLKSDDGDRQILFAEIESKGIKNLVCKISVNYGKDRLTCHVGILLQVNKNWNCLSLSLIKNKR